MAVTRPRRRMSRRRRSVKARRPWSRKVSTMDSSYRSVIPRIRNPDFGFPDKLVTKLRYVDSISLAAFTNGGIASNVFRMNSCFDPDLTSTGHQPMYFDQFCGAIGSAPYSRYRVLSSNITVTYTPVTISQPGTNNLGPYVIGLAANNASGLYGDTISELCEASNTQWTVMGGKDGGNNIKQLSTTYIPSRDLGMNDGDDTLGALYNANPTEVFHVIPWISDTVGTSAVRILVEIIYNVEFFDRNEVAGS